MKMAFTKEQLVAFYSGFRHNTVAMFGLHHVFFFLVVFMLLGMEFYYGPGALEHNIALRILDGQIPYVDFTCEYPPIALLAFLIPAIPFRESVSYGFGFAAMFLAMDFVIMFFMAKMARRFNLPVGKTLLIYTLCILAVGPIMICRYDIFPAMLTLLAIYAFISGKNAAAWALLALGFSAKFYPALLAPLFGLYLLRQGQWRRLSIGVVTFLGVIALTFLPWLISDPQSVLPLFTYHSDRALQCESVYATVIATINNIQGVMTIGNFNWGSWNVTGATADLFAKNSLLITGSLMAVIYIVYIIQNWRTPRSPKSGNIPVRLDNDTARSLIIYAAMAVIVFMLANKVFSPQYLIWLCPLLPLAVGRWYTPTWIAFIIAAAVTQYIFPYHYIELELFQTGPVYLMLIRNLLIFLILLMLLLSSGVVKPARRQPGADIKKTP